MRALAVEEFNHVSGGDRWGDSQWVAHDSGATSTQGHQIVEIIGRRDGGGIGLGDVLAIAGAVGGTVGAFVHWANPGVAVSVSGLVNAAGLGALASTGIVVVAVGVTFAIIYATRDPSPDPWVVQP